MEQLTAQVDGWEHLEDQGEAIDRIGLPFTPTVFADGVPAAVAESVAELLSPNTIPLDQISSNHQRSFEVGRADRVTALWQDQHGNSYTSMSYKGNNFTRQDITRSATAPSGFIPWGLQEDDALLRILKSSRMLRENGIATEWIVGLVEPKVLPYDNGLIGQAEYRKKLVEDAIGEHSVEEAAKIAAAIEPMTFFVTARCMEINDRPLDFMDDETSEQVQQRLQKIFTVYNLTHREDAEFRELSADSVEDCRYYFTTLLPTLQARNLARLHNMGLVHKFPYPGNVTALGGIIDLDSVHGEPLGIGDKPITFQDIRHDIGRIFDGDHSSYFNHVATSTGWLEDTFSTALDKMKLTFLDTYFQQNTRELTDREQFLLLLNVTGGAHAIDFTFQRLRDIVAEHDALCTQTSEDAGALMDHTRNKKMEMVDAYTARAMDERLEEGAERPTNDETAHLSMITMIGSTLRDIEEETIEDTLEQLCNGGASESFSMLAKKLEIEDKSGKDERAALANLFLAPHNVVKRVHGQPTEKQIQITNGIFTAIRKIHNNATDEDKRARLNLEYDLIEDENDPRLPLPDFYFCAMQYQIITSVGLDSLLPKLKLDDDHYSIQVHYSVDECPSMTELPVTHYITDASGVETETTISEDGVYAQNRTTTPDTTYMATVHAADEAGVLHVLIQKDE